MSPVDVIKLIPGRDGKNDSVFSNCLLAGSNSGYHHGQDQVDYYTSMSPNKGADALNKSDF